MKFRLLFCILLSGCYAYSQTAVSPKPFAVSPKSPNVSAMERYGNYEVNLFHGVPNIEIPIFEIKTKNLSVPITLSYHASGIKVSDVASWVGLGWNLSAGGAVSRKVKGIPDEDGFLRPDFTFKKPTEINPGTSEGFTYLRRMADRYIDTGPDVFAYSFPGKYGNFIYKDAVSPPVLIPSEPIKINQLKGASYLIMSNFQILDEKGTSYYYGQSITGEDAREGYDSQQGGTSSSGTSSWLMTDIVSADQKDTVSFKYHPPQHLTLSDEYSDYVSVTDNVATHTAACFTSNSIETASRLSNYSVNQKLMKEIVFNTGKVEFLLSGTDREDVRGRSLDRINVYTKNRTGYELLKSVRFYYSYFTGYKTSKLKLDSINVKSANELLSQTYRFDYNNSTNFPAVNSFSKDYWGYFNAANNSSLIPTTMINYLTAGAGIPVQIGGGTRDPNPDAVQIGILKRIQFPTGGSSVFDYEPNKYSNGYKELLGGGVRVKAIYSYPAENADPIIKSYVYGTESTPESGTGLLNSIRPLSFSSKKTKVYTTVQSGASFYLACSYNTRLFSVTPTFNINDYDDTNVYYPSVTEYIGTRGVNIGKKIYEYSNIYDQVVTTMQDEKPEVSSLHWQRGKLLSLKEFEAIGGINYKLKKETTNFYSVINPVTIPNIGCAISQVTDVIGPGLERSYYDGSYPPFYAYGFYDIYTGSYQITSSIVKNYDSAVPTQSLTKFSYNDQFQPSSIRSLKSNGDTLVTNYKYASDYGNYSPVNDAVGISNLLRLNLVSVPVEKTVSIKSPSGESKLISGEIKTFVDYQPLLKNEYYAEASQPVAGYEQSKIDGTGNLVIPSIFKKRLSYSDYDVTNNLTGFTTEPGKKNSLIWGYQKSAIISETENAQANQIAYSSFEEGGKGNWTYNESAVKLAENDCVTGRYVYDFSLSGEISKTSLPVGVYTVTYWSKKACMVNGTGPSVTGKANAKGWILYAHKIASSNGTVTVSSTNAVIDELKLYPEGAMMKTYTHLPLVGITSLVDKNDLIQYFDYDGLQRLKNIKDQNASILKNFTYYNPNPVKLGAYPQFYYNDKVSAIYNRTSCNSDQYGTAVNYVVAEGAYHSILSKEDAQGKANADLLANGQQYANQNGECRPKTEVIWEPIGRYCQVNNTGYENDVITNYGISVISVPNTTDFTSVTITRGGNMTSNISRVNFALYFNGTDKKIFGSANFNIDQVSVTVNIGVYPYTNEQRNGGGIVSVETANKFYTTGVSVYAQRQKRVGGQIVLTEPNLRGVGEGPYFEVITKGGDGYSVCAEGFRGDSPTYAAYANALFFKEFYKNCGAGVVGSRESYTVAAGKYTSAISQADANAKALADANTNGQAYADTRGSCPIAPPVCTGIDKKLINGICETGRKVYTSSIPKNNGTYVCNYHYVFSDGTSTSGMQEVSGSACLQE